MSTAHDAGHIPGGTRGFTLLESGRVLGAGGVARTSFGMILHVSLFSALVVATSLDYRHAQDEIPFVEEEARPLYLAPTKTEVSWPSEERTSQTVASAVETGDGDPAPTSSSTVEAVGDDEVQEVTIPAPAVEEFVLTEIEVDSAVTTDPSSGGPAYPIPLLDAHIEGEVLARFIVDTTGRADPKSFIALQSSHSGFTSAVRDALPLMKFRPARLKGAAVAQLVVQSFAFRINLPVVDTVYLNGVDTLTAKR